MRSTRSVVIGFVALMVAGLLVACGNGEDQAGPAEPSISESQNASMPSDGTSQNDDAALASGRTASATDCAVADDPEESMNAVAFKQSMACVVSLFPWPQGKQPNQAMVNDIVEAFVGWETAGFQRGMEYTTIASYNRCAWSEEWLESRRDGAAEREEAAMDMMLTFVPDPSASISGFPSDGYDQTTIDHLRGMAEQAELGDPSLIEADVTTNCSAIDWPQS